MGRQLKFVVGISVMLATVGFLVWTAVDQTKMYMISVAEFLDSGDAYADSTVRIAGKVAPGSMKWSAETRELEFAERTHNICFVAAVLLADREHVSLERIGLG